MLVPLPTHGVVGGYTPFTPSSEYVIVRVDLGQEVTINIYLLILHASIHFLGQFRETLLRISLVKTENSFLYIGENILIYEIFCDILILYATVKIH